MSSILSSIGLSVVQLTVAPNTSNSSKEEKLELLAHFLCINIFNSDQNVCEISHFQERWSAVSSSWPRNAHKGKSTIFQMNNYLLLGSNWSNSRTWNPLCVRSTFATFLKIHLSTSVLQTFYSASQLRFKHFITLTFQILKMFLLSPGSNLCECRVKSTGKIGFVSQDNVGIFSIFSINVQTWPDEMKKKTPLVWG